MSIRPYCQRCNTRDKEETERFCKRCKEHIALQDQHYEWERKRSEKRFKILSRPRYREAFITELIRELSKEHGYNDYKYTLKNAYESTMRLVEKRMPKKGS